jgi:hypothetical protein
MHSSLRIIAALSTTKITQVTNTRMPGVFSFVVFAVFVVPDYPRAAIRSQRALATDRAIYLAHSATLPEG